VRFLCDEMLKGLGRWLRAAGYDTAIAEGGGRDRDLARRSAAEGRVLLTKDRHLAAAAARRARVVALAGAGVEAEARALGAALAIDWLRAPFTRCLVDNAPLDPAPPDAGALVPEGSRAAGGPLRSCPLCGRLYWPGGHVRRMRARLEAWQAAAASRE
jgi:uncharacterized protein